MLRGVRGLLSLWVFCTLSLFFVFFAIAPRLENRIPLPTTLKKLRTVADELVFYEFEHPNWSLFLFSLLYIYKQSFAIPGSFILNILAGILFGWKTATVLLCVLAAIGASLCFQISAVFAKDVAMSRFSHQLKKIRNSLSRITDNPRILFFHLLSLRLLPLSPHWIFNVCSPFAGVPIKLHALSVAVGLIPYHYMCARAGALLFEIDSPSAVFTTPHVIFLLFLAGGMHFLGRYLQSETSLPRVTKI